MEVQQIYLNKYDWLIDVCYFTRKEDARDILNRLYMMGASDESLDKVACHIGCLNSGLAFTNPDSQHSLIVVSISDSIGEMFDTLVHEINHVCSAIEEEYNIDPHSEQASYLIVE